MADIQIEYVPQSTDNDRLLAALHSPDLSKDIPLVVNDKTTIYIPQWKIKKYGKKHFINKYKNLKK